MIVLVELVRVEEEEVVHVEEEEVVHVEEEVVVVEAAHYRGQTA